MATTSILDWGSHKVFGHKNTWNTSLNATCLKATASVRSHEHIREDLYWLPESWRQAVNLNAKKIRPPSLVLPLLLLGRRLVLVALLMNVGTGLGKLCAGDNVWTRLGLDGGFISTLTIDPQNAGNLY